jgi:hypothetical protein
VGVRRLLALCIGPLAGHREHVRRRSDAAVGLNRQDAEVGANVVGHQGELAGRIQDHVRRNGAEGRLIVDRADHAARRVDVVGGQAAAVGGALPGGHFAGRVQVAGIRVQGHPRWVLDVLLDLDQTQTASAPVHREDVNAFGRARGDPTRCRIGRGVRADVHKPRRRPHRAVIVVVVVVVLILRAGDRRQRKRRQGRGANQRKHIASGELVLSRYPRLSLISSRHPYPPACKDSVSIAWRCGRPEPTPDCR